MRQSVSLLHDFQSMVDDPINRLQYDPDAYRQCHDTLCTVLHGVLNGLKEFMTQQDFSHHDYVDMLQSVEYCEAALPRLYLTTLVTVALLDCYNETGLIGTLLVDGYEGLLMDLRQSFSSIRTPLKAIFLQSFAIELVGPRLSKTPASIKFLVSSLTDLNALWIRYGQIGPMSEVTTRYHQRCDLLNLITTPLQQINSIVVNEEEFVLEVLASYS